MRGWKSIEIIGEPSLLEKLVYIYPPRYPFTFFKPYVYLDYVFVDHFQRERFVVAEKYVPSPSPWMFPGYIYVYVMAGLQGAC